MMRNALCGVFVSTDMADEEIQRGSIKRQIARLIGNASIPIYVLGDDNRIVFANDALARLVGTESDALIGLDCSKNIPVDNAPRSQLAASLSLPPNVDRSVAQLHPVTLPGEPTDRICIAFPLEELPQPMMFCAIKENRGEWEALLGSRHRSRLQQSLIRTMSVATTNTDPWFLSGTSSAIARTRKQLQIVSNHRFGVHVVGSAAGSSLAVAKLIAQRFRNASSAKATGHAIVVECQLMDRELLRGTVEMIDEQSRILGKADGLMSIIYHQIDRLPEGLIDQLCDAKPVPSALLLATSASNDLISLHPMHSSWGGFAAMLESHMVHVPALAERLVDIEPLVVAWLEQAANTREAPQKYRWTRDFIDGMLAYSWPGDLDEFDATMREATIRCKDFQLTGKDLSASIRTYPSHVQRPEPLAKIDLDAFLEQMERDLIQQSLTHFRGNRTAAANHLGISRTRFLRRLQQLGIEPSGASHGADSEELVFEEWTDDSSGQATEPEK